MSQSTSTPKPSDRWIPYYFFAFFGLLVSVLVPMCIIAVRTNTGVVTDGAYEKGLAYNKTIQAAAEQESLHWKSDLTATSQANNKVLFVFSLSDAKGTPLNNAEVKLWLVRPTQSGQDQNTPMQAESNGQYAGEFNLPAHGLWEARISATSGGHNYQVTKRIVIP